jgi:hypothetical protein
VNRIVIAALLLIGTTARADVDGDDVDDHPLASDLRAAFGRGVSACRGNACTLDLANVACTTRGTATTCRAGQRTATGTKAAQLAAHLREIADADTIARIRCSSYKLETQDRLRGKCWVERGRGDSELEGVLRPFLEICKLGQFCWTGEAHVTCKSNKCTLECPAVAGSGTWDACRLDAGQVVSVTDAKLARQVRARTGKTTATMSCFTSGGTIDGGVTSLVACTVR